LTRLSKDIITAIVCLDPVIDC